MKSTTDGLRHVFDNLVKVSFTHSSAACSSLTGFGQDIDQEVRDYQTVASKLSECQMPDELLPESAQHSRAVIYYPGWKPEKPEKGDPPWPVKPVYVKQMGSTKRHKAKVVLTSDCLLVHGKGISQRLDLNTHLVVPSGKPGE